MASPHPLHPLHPSPSIKPGGPGHPGAAVRSSKLKPSPHSIPASRNPISMRHRRKPSSCKALPWPSSAEKTSTTWRIGFLVVVSVVIFMWFYICKPVSLLVFTSTETHNISSGNPRRENVTNCLFSGHHSWNSHPHTVRRFKWFKKIGGHPNSDQWIHFKGKSRIYGRIYSRIYRKRVFFPPLMGGCL